MGTTKKTGGTKVQDLNVKGGGAKVKGGVRKAGGEPKDF